MYLLGNKVYDVCIGEQGTWLMDNMAQVCLVGNRAFSNIEKVMCLIGNK